MVMGPQHRKDSRSGSASVEKSALEKKLAECGEISHALLEKLPSLTDIVVATDRETREDIGRRLTECEMALASEAGALHAARGAVPAPESRKLSQDLERRQGYLADLRTRAGDLFAHNDTLPVHVQMVSKPQSAELLTGFHAYREKFWRALYEVPGVQQIAMHQLRRIRDGEAQPSAVLHRAAVGQPDEKALRKDVTEVLADVAEVMGKKVRGKALADRVSTIATLLMRAPLDAGDLSELVITLRSQANRLADLEIALKCAHGSIRSKAAVADPGFPEWKALSAEFGGGAVVARAIVARVDKAQEPYVRIKQYLTTANLPFVQRIVMMNRRFQPLAGDMTQEGAIGFMRALDKFDPKSGFALLTYAGFWVKQRAFRSFEQQDGVVYLPTRLRAPLMKLSEQIPSDIRGDEAALARRIGVKLGELQSLIPFTRRAASLDASIKGTELVLGDTITTRGTGEYVAEVPQHDREEQRQRIAEALRTLLPREREIVIKRFGLDGQGERTLEHLAKEMGVTKERIRQLQNRALDHLKFGSAKEGLARLAEDI